MLSTFKFKKDPVCDAEFTPDVKFSAKLQERIQKATKDSNLLKQRNEAKNRKIMDYASLFKLAYKNDNFVTLPYIAENGKDYWLETALIVKDCYLRKHRVVFDLVVAKILS